MMGIPEELHKLEYTSPSIESIRYLFKIRIVWTELKYRDSIKYPYLINILNTLTDEKISEEIHVILYLVNIE